MCVGSKDRLSELEGYWATYRGAIKAHQEMAPVAQYHQEMSPVAQHHLATALQGPVAKN